MEKCIRDGKVAVLVSPGHGAGWSTWCSGSMEFLAMDKTLVGMREHNAPEEEVETYAQRASGSPYVYMGGWSQVRVEWVPVGTRFRIDEYDGYETLIPLEDHNWLTV